MPSLIKFLFVLGVLGGLVFGGMFALTVVVEPTPREMTIKIPASKLKPK